MTDAGGFGLVVGSLGSGRVSRDVVMFVLGAGGFIHEILVTGLDRPYALTACLALMGLPLILNGKGEKK